MTLLRSIVAGCLLLGYAQSASALMYQHLAWPSGEYYNYDQSIIVLTDPGPESYFFWAAQFEMQDSVGYMGLVTDALYQGSNLGPGVNVAIWGATSGDPAPGAKIDTNTDGDPGIRLVLPFTWSAGTLYRLRIWEVAADSQSVTWGFWITDMVTSTDTPIGTITSPLSLGRIAPSTSSWTEYYGPGRDDGCNGAPWDVEAVLWLNPYFNGETVQPTSSTTTTSFECSRFEQPALNLPAYQGIAPGSQ